MSRLSRRCRYTPPEEKRGVAGSAGALADAPKGDAAAERPTGGDTEVLQSEMDVALDLRRSLVRNPAGATRHL